MSFTQNSRASLDGQPCRWKNGTASPPHHRRSGSQARWLPARCVVGVAKQGSRWLKRLIVYERQTAAARTHNPRGRTRGPSGGGDEVKRAPSVGMSTLARPTKGPEQHSKHRRYVTGAEAVAELVQQQRAEQQKHDNCPRCRRPESIFRRRQWQCEDMRPNASNGNSQWDAHGDAKYSPQRNDQ